MASLVNSIKYLKEEKPILHRENTSQSFYEAGIIMIT